MGMLKLHGTDTAEAPGVMDRVARRFVLDALAKFPKGQLRLREPDGEVQYFGAGAPVAALDLVDWRTYRMMFTGGALGAGEAYMEGLWQSEDLTAVIRYFAANVKPMQALEGGVARLGAPLRSALHYVNRNSLTGSRRNIAAHYDLGNDFFRLFLDDTMMYSAAVYPAPDSSLEEASTYKLDLICKQLGLGPQHHLLEIGTGWGGLAVHAARHYGCRVTTTTISREQYQYAQNRVRDASLEHQITVLDRDYRQLDGRYDRIVSVEMIEAVGADYLPVYFRKLGDLLTDDGVLLLQAITIPHQRYHQALREMDFIKRYIFPGGFLPSVNVMIDHLVAQTRLMPVGLIDIGIDYARTLHDWRQRFIAARSAVLGQGFDERFLRMWDYYLCYCEGAFLERAISTVQLTVAGPAYKPALDRQ